VNPVFVDKTFPWLMQPFTRFLPATAQPLVDHLALAAPAFEVAAGIGLLTRRFRAAALIGAIGMHVFILAALGPLGRGFNAVVWPWNLAMMAFLLILFFRRADDPAPLEIIWGRAFAFQKIVLVLFAAMPLFSLFDLWDHYLSSALYSGNIGSAAIYLNDAVFDRLPDVVEDYIYEEGPNLNRLDILDWSLGEMNVPSYPETRVFQSVARKICSYASGDPSIELVVQRKLALLRGKRRFVYHCADLVK
jgi:hypothetical protein